MHQVYNRNSCAISIWLGFMCLAIILMVFIGGLTRLTESGLSITEWKPVTGIVPPMNAASWEVEFDKYKQSPEYIKHNMGMDLPEFKSIYLLEFFHRIAGRLTGLLYILPLIWFLARGYIRPRNAPIYLVALGMLAAQGFMGWYMVKSGLVSDPHVSPARLAMHLMLAVFLYIIMFWQLMKNSFDIMLLPSDSSTRCLSFWGLASIMILLIQMVLGGFVAGLDAGLVYNEWPLMGDGFLPDEVSLSNLNFASWKDSVFVQLMHRMVAYLLFIVTVVFCIIGLRLDNRKFSRVLISVLTVLLLQVGLGIATLIYNVPIILALLHQFGAILLLSFLLWAYFLIKHSENS